MLASTLLLETTGDRPAERRTTGETPHAGYEYRVFGRRYTGGGLRLMEPTCDTRAEVQRVVKDSPVGSCVRVYYKPDDPATFLLWTGADLDGCLVLIGGALWAGICAIIVVVTVAFVSRRGRRQARKAGRRAQAPRQQARRVR